jgi:hypothetical protein
MTDPVAIHVPPPSEVRQRLSGILARFRSAAALEAAEREITHAALILLDECPYPPASTMKSRLRRSGTGPAADAWLLGQPWAGAHPQPCTRVAGNGQASSVVPPGPPPAGPER